MGKDTKKSLDELKDDLKTINKSEQDKVRGGTDKDKDKEKNKWNSGLGGIVPQ